MQLESQKKEGSEQADVLSLVMYVSGLTQEVAHVECLLFEKDIKEYNSFTRKD